MIGSISSMIEYDIKALITKVAINPPRLARPTLSHTSGTYVPQMNTLDLVTLHSSH